MTTQELYQNLLLELDRSLIVEDETRDYWLNNYQKLPVSAVELFCSQLREANDHIDTMIATGLDANPGLADQIILKSKDAKKKVFKFLEMQEVKEENPEDFLKQNLT